MFDKISNVRDVQAAGRSGFNLNYALADIIYHFAVDFDDAGDNESLSALLLQCTRRLYNATSKPIIEVAGSGDLSDVDLIRVLLVNYCIYDNAASALLDIINTAKLSGYYECSGFGTHELNTSYSVCDFLAE